MVGGLLVSQVLTLYITPVIYIYLERFQKWMRGNRPGPVALEPDRLASS